MSQLCGNPEAFHNCMQYVQLDVFHSFQILAFGLKLSSFFKIKLLKWRQGQGVGKRLPDVFNLSEPITHERPETRERRPFPVHALAWFARRHLSHHFYFQTLSFVWNFFIVILEGLVFYFQKKDQVAFRMYTIRINISSQLSTKISMSHLCLVIHLLLDASFIFILFQF